MSSVMWGCNTCSVSLSVDSSSLPCAKVVRFDDQDEICEPRGAEHTCETAFTLGTQGRRDENKGQTVWTAQGQSYPALGLAVQLGGSGQQIGLAVARVHGVKQLVLVALRVDLNRGQTSHTHARGKYARA